MRVVADVPEYFGVVAGQTLAEIEVPELVPFGQEDDSVGAPP